MTQESPVMHDIKWIRENPAAFDRGLARRGLAPQAERLLQIDERRRAIIQKLEGAQARRNAASKEIGQAKAKKDEATAQGLMAEVAELKTAIPAMEANEKEASKQLNEALAEIPNLPLDEVPDGDDAEGNVQHHHFGARRNYAFTPKQHFELGEALGQMDFETAAKLSGARFVVLKQGLARLERAIGQFMLDVHTGEHGYTEVNPPLLVRDDVMFGTAQLPKFEDDQYFSATPVGLEPSEESLIEIAFTEYLNSRRALEHKSNSEPDKFRRVLNRLVFERTWSNQSALSAWLHNLIWAQRQRGFIQTVPKERHWLIPTAEVPLTNLVRESILEEDQLPMRLTALTPCFRAEAGAAGKDTRGMIRQHQFTKVELVSITTPQAGKDEHERMLSCAEEVLRRLDLHYQVMTLCTGDMGFASQKTYDIEVWLPGQNMYREISSCSICGEFQARRMSARYRTKEGRAVRHVHTLNGSGVAVGRALIAVMENYQEADGSIVVPDALAPYMGGLKKIERRA
jgi:seryl-tRNA synthetase